MDGSKLGVSTLHNDVKANPYNESMNHKIDYIQEHDLGGIMFWELSGDAKSGGVHELLNLTRGTLTPQ